VSDEEPGVWTRLWSAMRKTYHNEGFRGVFHLLAIILALSPFITIGWNWAGREGVNKVVATAEVNANDE